MPSAPTEILSYESRTSIGDKIRKEGVFEVNSLLYFFIGIVYLPEGGKVCFFTLLRRNWTVRWNNDNPKKN